MSTGKWVNKFPYGWHYEGHGWGVYWVKKEGGPKGHWYSYHEEFGGKPVGLGHFATRLEAQAHIESIVARLSGTKSNREIPTGRYTLDPETVCVCGHPLGDHLAEGRLSEKSCTACACGGFKRGAKLNPRKRNGNGHSGDTATRSEVRSPTRTATRTSTSTEADTQGNLTVTGGAGRGATTTVTVRGYPRGKSTRRHNPKRKASAAQLAARAKFTAMVKSGRKIGSKVAKVGRKSVAAVQAYRQTNPAGRYQLAALCRGTVCYLAGLGLSSNRGTASNFGTLSAARKTAQQIKTAGAALGVTAVAIVGANDSPSAIKDFLSPKA